MSTLSTFVNNFDLILQHRDLILSHAPYRHSVITFPVLGKRKSAKMNREDGPVHKSYLGSYLYIWDDYKKRWPDGDLLPLRVTGSPFSGCVASFLGYSFSQRKLIREVPKGFTTGSMFGPIRNFTHDYPAGTLALPLEKVIDDLKQELPLEATSGYSLLTLADEFYDILGYISGIERGGLERIKYKLKQDLSGKPVVQIDAELEIMLTAEERRRSVMTGSAVYVAELVQGGKLKLAAVAREYGFEVTEKQQGNNAAAHLRFALTLPDFDQVLEMQTLKHIAGFMHQIVKGCQRF